MSNADDEKARLPPDRDPYYTVPTDAELREAGATFGGEPVCQCGDKEAIEIVRHDPDCKWLKWIESKRVAPVVEPLVAWHKDALSIAVEGTIDPAVVEPVGEPKTEEQADSEAWERLLAGARYGDRLRQLTTERDTALAAAERWRKSSEQYQALALERFDQVRELEAKNADAWQSFRAEKRETDSLRASLATVERERDELKAELDTAMAHGRALVDLTGPVVLSLKEQLSASNAEAERLRSELETAQQRLASGNLEGKNDS